MSKIMHLKNFVKIEIASVEILLLFIFRYLRNVTVEGGFGKPDIAFSSDGTLKSVELKIMNLRPGISSNLVWEVVRFFQ